MKRLEPNEAVLVVYRGKLAVMYRDHREEMESATGFKMRHSIAGDGFRFEDYADEGVTWIRGDATVAEREAFLAAHALT